MMKMCVYACKQKVKYHQLSASERPVEIGLVDLEITRNKQTDKHCKKNILLYMYTVYTYIYVHLVKSGYF